MLEFQEFEELPGEVTWIYLVVKTASVYPDLHILEMEKADACPGLEVPEVDHPVLVCEFNRVLRRLRCSTTTCARCAIFVEEQNNRPLCRIKFVQ